MLDRDAQSLEQISNSAASGFPFPSNSLSARRPVATVSPCPLPTSVKLAMGTYSRAATTPMSAASGASRGSSTLKWSNDGQPLSSTLSVDSFERAPLSNPTAVQQTHRFLPPPPAPAAGLFGVSESADDLSSVTPGDPWNQQPPAMAPLGEASSPWAQPPINMAPFVTPLMSRLDQWTGTPFSSAAARRLQFDASNQSSWSPAAWPPQAAPPADASGLNADPIMRPLFFEQQTMPFRPPQAHFMPFEMPPPSTFMQPHPSVFLQQAAMRPPIPELPMVGTASAFDQIISSETSGAMVNLSMTDGQYNWQQRGDQNFMAGQMPAFFPQQQQHMEEMFLREAIVQRGVEEAPALLSAEPALSRVPQQSRLRRYVAASNSGAAASPAMQMPPHAAFDPASVVAGLRAPAQLRDAESPVADTPGAGGDAGVGGSGAKARPMTLPTITLNPNAPIFSVAPAPGPDEARQSDRVTSSPSAFDVDIGFRPPTQSPPNNAPGARRPRQH